MFSLQLFSRVKYHPFIYAIPLSVTFFFFDITGLNYGFKFALAGVSIGLYFLMRNTKVTTFVQDSNKTAKALFIAAAVYAGFSILGQQLFFAAYPVPQVVGKSLFFVLFCSWLAFPFIALLYFTDKCKGYVTAYSQAGIRTPEYSTAGLYSIFLGILLGCWSLYIIAFFPANMSIDSFDMWRQATGQQPLNDAHPVFYTIIIRALIAIWPSPAIVAISHVVFLAAICSSFLVFLYKAGIPVRWLLLFTVLTGIMPTNGVMAVTIWKDIPYCTALLWLTLISAELVTKRYIFSYKITLTCLTASLVCVALLRHNGVFAALFMSVFLIGWAIKNKRTGIIVATSAFLLLFAGYKKVILPTWLQVNAVPSGFQLAPPVHGIASVIYYNGTLSPETMQQMEKLLPVEVWKSHYSPWSADAYLFETNTPFISNLSQVPTSKVIGMYANTFIHNPFLIVKDRLCGAELLWNVNQAEGSSNYSVLPMIEENDLGLQQHDNFLKKALTGFMQFAGRALDPVSRRAGIYNILLFFLFAYIIKQRKSYYLIFLAVTGSNLSLILSMTFQSLRYVYYVPLLFGFIWLLIVSNVISYSKTTK
jgi:hypothetical protein